MKYSIVLALLLGANSALAVCPVQYTQECKDVTTTVPVTTYYGYASCWDGGTYISQNITNSASPVTWISQSVYNYQTYQWETKSCLASVPFSNTQNVTQTKKVCTNVEVPYTAGCNTQIACSTYATNVSTSNIQSVVGNAQSHCGACGINVSAVPSGGPYFSGLLDVKCGR